MPSIQSDTTIAAVSTPPGVGGIAVIRVSGPDAFTIVDKMWEGRPLADIQSHTAHLGIISNSDGTPLDQAVITLFRSPNSFTGEDTVEISVHGSQWIQRQTIFRLLELGAVAAQPGEFTQRAFLNGRMDLAQAEAVADIIAASSKAAHRIAIQQMSGSFSNRLNHTRQQLIDFASLLELELDFSEEDVEFVDRKSLVELADNIKKQLSLMADSYAMGNVFRTGIPVAIAGPPNVGKSTLLNLLLNDDKAIVSDIPGTTRDIIDDTVEIDGYLFRFYDTAGIRTTDDSVEQIGIQRAHRQIDHTMITLWMIDLSQPIQPQIEATEANIALHPNCPYHIIILNKEDISPDFLNQDVQLFAHFKKSFHIIAISAKENLGIEELKAELTDIVKENTENKNGGDEIILTNARHYEAIREGLNSLERVTAGIKRGQSTDLIAQDVREVLHHLSQITGEISTPTLLTNIFSKFCIGK